MAADMVSSLLTGLVDNAPTILEQAGTMMEEFLDTILGALPLLLDAGTEIIANLLQGITENGPSIIEQIGSIIIEFVGTIWSYLPDLLISGGEMITTLLAGLVDAAPGIISQAASMLIEYVQEILSHLPEVLEAGISLIGELLAGILEAVPKLIMEIMNAGESSHTDIAICYMKDRVDEKLLEMIKKRISNLKVDALTMNQESLAECIYPHKWYNPFPKFKFTERPDATAACILEGNIAILVDNSPSAMVLPSSIFDIIEEADDYYFPPITGTYLRLSRMSISLLTLILTPLWLVLLQNPGSIPPWLDFIRLSEPPHVPVFYQLLLLEFAIDGLRLAAINTPSMLTTPLSVIAGIVLGEYSVKSGSFSSETMLYMAFVTVANYSQASFELGYALKFMRILILILTALFNWYGFWGGIILSLCAVIFNKTIAGKSYIYPLIPFHLNEIKKRILRPRLPHTEK